MKRALLLATIMMGTIVLEAYAQCNKTHYFCTGQLTKEQQQEYWNLNNQSKSAAIAKGEKYNLSFVAYKGYDYRLSVCTDITEGAGEKVQFTLFQDAIVRVKDEFGNTNIKKQKEAIFKNADEGNQPYVQFATDKTRKFYLEVSVPSSGESKNRKLNQADKCCLGVLLEHRKTPKLGF